MKHINITCCAGILYSSCTHKHIKLTIGAQISQEGSKAPDAVAAHLGLTAIAVVDPHGKIIAALHFRRALNGIGLEGEDNSVTTNAKVAIAQPLRLLGRERRGGLVPIVNEDEIVAQTLVLGEFDGVPLGDRERRRGGSGSARCHGGGRGERKCTGGAECQQERGSGS